jgi:hypothetical protein
MLRRRSELAKLIPQIFQRHDMALFATQLFARQGNDFGGLSRYILRACAPPVTGRRLGRAK